MGFDSIKSLLVSTSSESNIRKKYISNDKRFRIVMASVVGCLSLDLVLQVAARIELTGGEPKFTM